MNPESLLTGVRDALAARTVYGEPVERGGVTAAAGFGLHGRPVAGYVIDAGEVTWRPAVDPARGLPALRALFALWSFARRR